MDCFIKKQLTKIFELSIIDIFKRCRVSSVGRARDWKSLCPWFNSETRHFLCVNNMAWFFCYTFNSVYCIFWDHIVLFQVLLKLQILRAKSLKHPRIRVLSVHFSRYFSLSKSTQKSMKWTPTVLKSFCP